MDKSLDAAHTHADGVRDTDEDGLPVDEGAAFFSLTAMWSRLPDGQDDRSGASVDMLPCCARARSPESDA